jgi:hypothetical protein
MSYVLLCAPIVRRSLCNFRLTTTIIEPEQFARPLLAPEATGRAPPML